MKRTLLLVALLAVCGCAHHPQTMQVDGRAGHVKEGASGVLRLGKSFRLSGRRRASRRKEIPRFSPTPRNFLGGSGNGFESRSWTARSRNTVRNSAQPHRSRGVPGSSQTTLTISAFVSSLQKGALRPSFLPNRQAERVSSLIQGGERNNQFIVCCWPIKTVAQHISGWPR
jgi:hypothetical protein